MAQWTLNIPDETDRSVRMYLERTGGSESDLSAFVDRIVRREVFWNTVRKIQDQNTDLTPEEAQALADEAVDEVRESRS